MRKATLGIGLLYALWGGWQIFTISQLLTLYHQFNAVLPQSSYFLPITILGFSLFCIVSYFMNIKNHLIYKILFVLGIGGIALYFMYFMLASNTANKKINEMLNEVQN